MFIFMLCFLSVFYQSFSLRCQRVGFSWLQFRTTSERQGFTLVETVEFPRKTFLVSFLLLPSPPHLLDRPSLPENEVAASLLYQSLGYEMI
jgi:hypothetical protein